MARDFMSRLAEAPGSAGGTPSRLAEAAGSAGGAPTFS
jgi:hypothetical protein